MIEQSHADEKTVHYYTQGECHALAIAIHRLTKWNILVILDSGNPFYESEDGDGDIPSVIHVYCVDENNIAYDIKGSRDAKDVKSELDQIYDIDEYVSDIIYSEEELHLHYIDSADNDDDVEKPLGIIDEEDIQNAIEEIYNSLSHLNPLLQRPSLSMKM